MTADTNSVPRLLHALLGSKITVSTRSGTRYSAILAGLNASQSSATGPESITLAQVDTLPLATNPNAFKPHLVLPWNQVAELHAADVAFDPPTASQESNGTSTSAPSKQREGFRTDTDISNTSFAGREKQLQAWSSPVPSSSTSDALELGSSRGGGGAWDQFATNESKFGARTNYDEELYTTKLDRNGKDFKARERKAAELEREILKGSTSTSLHNNAHMAEERGEAIEDSGLDEEDKYSGVIRGAEAYVPPGARKAHLARLGNSPSPISTASTPQGSTSNGSAVPKIQEPSTSATTSVPPQTQTLNSTFRDFVKEEKIRLTQKRQEKQEALKSAERKDQDSRIASLMEFSREFKLKTPIPADVASIIGKKPTTVAVPASTNNTPKPAATPLPSLSQKPTPASTATSPVATPQRPLPSGSVSTTPIKKVLVPEIPPFDPERFKKKLAEKENASSSTSAEPAEVKAPAPASKKLTANAPAFVFKPNPNASSFTPGFTPSVATSSPAAISSPAMSSRSLSINESRSTPPPPPMPVNPFFGSKVLKKGSSSMHVKEDFTPFKNTSKVLDAGSAPASWAFTGKPYISIFPNLGQSAPPPQHQQHLQQFSPSPHLHQQQQPHHGPHHPQRNVSHTSSSSPHPQHAQHASPAIAPPLSSTPSSVDDYDHQGQHLIPPPPPFPAGLAAMMAANPGGGPQAGGPYQAYQPPVMGGGPGGFRGYQGPPPPQHHLPPGSIYQQFMPHLGGPPQGVNGGGFPQPPGPHGTPMFQPSPQMQPPQQPYLRYVPGPGGPPPSFQPGGGGGGGGGPPPPSQGDYGGAAGGGHGGRN